MIVYFLAMHGVGAEWIQRAFNLFSIHGQMQAVSLQEHPDPEFPTVVFPNPEEKGVSLQ